MGAIGIEIVEFVKLFKKGYKNDEVEDRIITLRELPSKKVNIKWFIVK